MAIWAGIITAIVGAGLSAGVAAASAPDFADPAKSSRKTVLASLRALPGQRMVDQAARLGQSVDYPTGKMVPTFDTRSMSIEDALAGKFITQGEYNRLTQTQQPYRGNGPIIPGKDPSSMIEVKVPTGHAQQTRTADFTGYGDADIQGRLARSMAEIGLDLQQKYGEDFADASRQQAEQADPEGTAARRMLADRINEMEAGRATRERPVSDLLSSQIENELKSGRTIDADMEKLLAETVARRGGTTIGGADIGAELEKGPAGEQRQRDRLQRSLALLTSGQAPEDLAFRDEQQSMANMAAFLAGRTPTSQFGNLAAGQQGASPALRGPSLPGVDPNLQQNATQAGIQSYGAGVRQAANEVSPWFMGLNAAVRGAQVAGGAGWQPFGRN